MTDQLFDTDGARLPVEPVARLEVRVLGMPAPQGSKRAIIHKSTGRPIVVESSAAVRPWREAVKLAAADARQRPGRPTVATFAGPLSVTVHFTIERPKGHFGTGRNAGRVKPGAPAAPAVRPDLDKLVRSTLDALRDAGVYRDDGQIVYLHAWKMYGSPPGALVTVASW